MPGTAVLHSSVKQSCDNNREICTLRKPSAKNLPELNFLSHTQRNISLSFVVTYGIYLKIKKYRYYPFGLN